MSYVATTGTRTFSLFDFSDDKDRAIPLKERFDCFHCVLFRSVAKIDPPVNEIWISFDPVVSPQRTFFL